MPTPRVLITSGPTHEPIDPVRFLANHSSGKQGHALAEAFVNAGAEVVLISGPVLIPPPSGLALHIAVQTAYQMYHATLDQLPADIVVCAAAVCDWRVKTPHPHKLKKLDPTATLTLELIANDDILHTVSTHSSRPSLVIGFAAETDEILKHAEEKLRRKRCDWIIANSVLGEHSAFGSDENQIWLVTRDTTESWPRMSKRDIATRLVERALHSL